MKVYRVCINHRAGHLIIRKVEASSKQAAERAVRETFPAAALGRTSSVTVA